MCCCGVLLAALPPGSARSCLHARLQGGVLPAALPTADCSHPAAASPAVPQPPPPFPTPGENVCLAAACLWMAGLPAYLDENDVVRECSRHARVASAVLPPPVAGEVSVAYVVFPSVRCAPLNTLCCSWCCDAAGFCSVCGGAGQLLVCAGAWCAAQWAWCAAWWPNLLLDYTSPDPPGCHLACRDASRCYEALSGAAPWRGCRPLDIRWCRSVVSWLDLLQGLPLLAATLACLMDWAQPLLHLFRFSCLFLMFLGHNPAVNHPTAAARRPTRSRRRRPLRPSPARMPGWRGWPACRTRGR